MNRKTMMRIILGLLVASVCVYIAQILIFRDPRNTAFYIFQDMAFFPITIAIATLVVGELMENKARKQRLEKTRMLSSSFFTEIGFSLMTMLMEASDCRNGVDQLMASEADTKRDVKALLAEADAVPVHVTLNEATYENAIRLIEENKTGMMVLASNPMLLEHEDFTEMIWGIFHLLDEHRLRGNYMDLSKADIAHFNEDFSRVLKLLVKTWIPNMRYLRKNFPNFYAAAKIQIKEK